MPSSGRMSLLAMMSILFLWGCHSKNPVTSEEPDNSRYSLGVLRESWTIASPAIDVGTMEALPARGSYDPALHWFNPYFKFMTADVYDSVPEGQHGSQIDVLILKFAPHESALYDTHAMNGSELWAGVMRGLPRARWDQSQAGFLELRLGVVGFDTLDTPVGLEQTGNLHIDLGRIDEDVNANGTYDTEDRDGNGVLSQDEDVGLDLVADEYESGYDPLTNPDPAGDDWGYDSHDPYNVDRINGTERNETDYVLGRPDSEDIGGPGEFDRANSYYEFTIDFGNDTAFVVEGSEKNSEEFPPMIWRTYRIPLWDTRYHTAIDADGPPDSTQIQFVRLWLDNVSAAKMSVCIAAQDLVQFPDDTTSSGTDTR